jgi:hypothetical protein
MAATVSRPSGGKAERLWINFRACLKLQKVSGKDGYKSNVFMDLLYYLKFECISGFQVLLKFK